MGGLACSIPVKALLRFDSVPTEPASVVSKFDQQIRELYANPLIATSVADETPHGEQVCDVLAKAKFTHLDRVMLFDVIESLYED